VSRPNAPVETEALSGAALQRALVRISHEIVERHGDELPPVLIGMRTRGVPLAQRIARTLAELSTHMPPVGAIDISLHRDDLPLRSATAPLQASDLPAAIDDRIVVLVDDVLFTGRSIRAALDALIDYGRPAAIELAVLIDRGHRELPIRPDYVGKNLPTHRDDEVLVLLEETDGRDQVLLRSRIPAASGQR
jgi:pyrimidine operon attenuation protein/uracil phosphoribosyltransferase